MLRIDEDALLSLQHFASASPLAVIATDATGIVQVWSPAAERLYGFSSAECLGQPITALTVHPLDGAIANLIMAQVRAGRPWAGRYHAHTKSGEVIEVFVMDAPLYSPDGEFCGVVGVSIDVGSDMTSTSPRWLALKSVAAEISQMRERERSEVARRLHDDVGQVISMVRLEVSAIAADTKLPPETAARCQRLFDDLDIAVKSVRDMSNDLHYRDFDVWLLVLRLFDLADELERDDHTAAICEIAVPVETMRKVSSRTAYAAYNIAREAVSNVRRHAQAQLVRLRLDAVNDELRVVIEDNGVGIGDTAPGIGRSSMRDRASAVCGRVEVVDRSATGEVGTRVSAVLPLNDGGGVADERTHR